MVANAGIGSGILLNNVAAVPSSLARHRRAPVTAASVSTKIRQDCLGFSRCASPSTQARLSLQSKRKNALHNYERESMDDDHQLSSDGTGQTLVTESLVEEVSIDGMCGVY